MGFKYLDQWQALLINFSVNEADSLKIFGEILIQYGEDGRYYHTLSHIKEVLLTAAELRHLALDYPAVQLAGWFHDIVYDPKSAENELQSAALAESLLREVEIPENTIQKVGRMILATASHTNPAHDPDTDILLDADLAVLGSEAETFRDYCAAIRKEYDWVAEADYRAGRLAVLKGFLERPRIYNTPLLYERLEEKARENLRMEINRLS